MKYTTYKEWFLDIQWLKDKVILPNNIKVSKSDYITSKGFDIDGFNSLLFKTYIQKFKNIMQLKVSENIL